MTVVYTNSLKQEALEKFGESRMGSKSGLVAVLILQRLVLNPHIHRLFKWPLADLVRYELSVRCTMRPSMSFMF